MFRILPLTDGCILFVATGWPPGLD